MRSRRERIDRDDFSVQLTVAATRLLKVSCMAWSGTAACTDCTVFLAATLWAKRTAFQKRKDKRQLDEEGRLLQEYVIARASHKLSVWIQVSTRGCNAMHDTDQSFETLHL